MKGISNETINARKYFKEVTTMGKSKETRLKDMKSIGLEINYDLYDDLESLSKFMGDSQQDYSDTDCDPHSLGNSKNLKNNNFKK